MVDLTELQRLAEGASRFTFTKDAHGWVQDCDTWELQDYIAAMSPDTAKKLIAVALAAKYVAYSNGFDAALPDKLDKLRAALQELAGSPQERRE